MTILRVDHCQDGLVRKDAWGINANGQKQWGVTGQMKCEKCDGKGCPPAGRPTAASEA